MEYSDIYPLICDILSGNKRSSDKAAVTASLHNPILDDRALVATTARRSALQLHEQMAHVGSYHLKNIFPELT